MSFFDALRNLLEGHRFGTGRLDRGGNHGFRQRPGTPTLMTDQQSTYTGFAPGVVG